MSGTRNAEENREASPQGGSWALPIGFLVAGVGLVVAWLFGFDPANLIKGIVFLLVMIGLWPIARIFWGGLSFWMRH